MTALAQCIVLLALAAGRVGDGPDPYEFERARATVVRAAVAKAAPSIVTIESGLTLTDRVIVNGLTKARPGTPVEPQAWELKPPPAEKAK